MIQSTEFRWPENGGFGENQGAAPPRTITVSYFQSRMPTVPWKSPSWQTGSGVATDAMRMA